MFAMITGRGFVIEFSRSNNIFRGDFSIFKKPLQVVKRFMITAE